MSSYDWTRIYQQVVEDEDDPKPAESQRPAAGAAGSRGMVPPNAAAAFRDRSVERRVFELSTEEKLAAMNRFRCRGNALYREGQFDKACQQYQAALLYYEYTFPDEEAGPVSQEAADALRLKCLANSAAVNSAAQNWGQVVEATTGVLQVDPMSTKSLVMRAKARRCMGELSKADADLRAAAAQPGAARLRAPIEAERKLLRGTRAFFSAREKEAMSALWRPRGSSRGELGGPAQAGGSTDLG